MTANLQIPPEFDNAPKTERIAFVEELWDRIAEDTGVLPLSSEHQLILNERLNSYQNNPQAGKPWSEVRERLLSGLRSS